MTEIARKTFPVQDALRWDLRKTCLLWELTDRAEDAIEKEKDWVEETGKTFHDTEVETKVTVEGDQFVVSFHRERERR